MNQPQPSQVEIGEAIAEQQAKLGDKMVYSVTGRKTPAQDLAKSLAANQPDGKRAGDLAVDLNTNAVRAQELAQQGRLSEAKELLATLEKEEKDMAQRLRRQQSGSGAGGPGPAGPRE